MYHNYDPIIALATPYGRSAIALIRLTGKGIISIVNQVFSGKDLTKQPSHTIHFGVIQENDKIIDEVLASIFIAPYSFTKEDAVEISCHGSPFIIEQLLQLFVRRGVQLAEPGAFTKRAFLNGRFDLTQAEAVADLIASDASLNHQIALSQMRGGFSSHLEGLRKELIHFSAMLELELDFSEEDVAFLDRNQLKSLADQLIHTLSKLMESFRLGNVIKHGLSVVIVGQPNAGKSTLLNRLLQEERAIVSPQAGTTRDSIEGTLQLGGILCRFIDTAGLRDATTNIIETMGMERTRIALAKAFAAIYMVDLTDTSLTEAEEALARLQLGHLPLIKLGNKMDISSIDRIKDFNNQNYLIISAHHSQGIDQLKQQLTECIQGHTIHNMSTMVVNVRHYERLQKSKTALESARNGLEAGISNEWLATDIHSALHALGEITGEITTDDILGEIFGKFCIGK